jgi:branched-chain amino acid transport system substrate-binding protein
VGRAWSTGEGGGLSRREVLRRLGLAGGALAVAPSVLAACGGDNSDNSSSGTTAAGGGSASSSGGGGGDAGARLKSVLGLKDTDKLGGDLNWKMGAVLALTGNGSYYGKTMSNGINLAVKHIKAAGGPTIEVIYKDHKSGDPQAGVNAVTELGSAKIPAKLASYGDDIGAMIPRTEQYKIMTLDGGGGVGGSTAGKPYLWGCRAQVALDQFPGLFHWTKDQFPDVKTVGFAGWDLGEPLNTDLRTLMTKAIADAGYQFNGLLEQFQPNSADFSQVLPKIKSNKPDLLLLYAFGQDPGGFMNQAQSAGLDANIVGFEFTPDGLTGAKGAFEKGWTFTYDYFDAPNAVSPLGKFFVSEFKAAYKDDPDFYAANYYEDTLAMWDLIRRVLASGGDVNSGTDLENALKANPVFISVYGGDATTNGTLKLDLTTHSVSQRFMGVFTYEKGKVTPRATFDIGGANYKKLG